MNESDGADEIILDPAPAVTTEQLRLAVTAALVAAAQHSARAGVHPYRTITGETAAWIAAAIAKAFPADTSADQIVLKGLIWRGIFAFGDMVNDDRFTEFSEEASGRFSIHTALMTAVAETPMRFGGETPVDTIFIKAQDGLAKSESKLMMSITSADARATRGGHAT